MTTLNIRRIWKCIWSADFENVEYQQSLKMQIINWFKRCSWLWKNLNNRLIFIYLKTSNCYFNPQLALRVRNPFRSCFFYFQSVMEDSESLDDAVTDFFHKNQDPNYLIASSAEGVIQGIKVYFCPLFKARPCFYLTILTIKLISQIYWYF